ncbi:hypothetical protein [Halolamina salina]|uniref:Uncharacterized protein n=1 Tax=Halolamina salina TaxID=1220023 RepID=A0ABD6B5L9_9EURY
MSPVENRDELVKNAGLLTIGLLFGGAAAYLTQIPATAVFAVVFGVLIVREFSSA